MPVISGVIDHALLQAMYGPGIADKAIALLPTALEIIMSLHYHVKYKR